MERKVRAWELIEEDDGSTTMLLEMEDGTREELHGVEIEKIEETTTGVGMTSIPMTFVVKP